jgi:isoaspartyl peptidase/L-asparaginase-like protein (Ntn-hydrolase superfamily)
MRWAGQGLEQAAEDVVQALLAPAGGSGGLIAVDARGRVALPFNCEGMYRGVVGADGVLRTAIHREDFRVEAV